MGVFLMLIRLALTGSVTALLAWWVIVQKPSKSKSQVYKRFPIKTI